MLAVELFPSCPLLLLPQQYTLPLLLIAQACPPDLLALIAIGSERFATVVEDGANTFVVEEVPRPN